jgi:hypothetical protein
VKHLLLEDERTDVAHSASLDEGSLLRAELLFLACEALMHCARPLEKLPLNASSPMVFL